MLSLGVIFSVYEKTDILKFINSIESIIHQTLLPQSIIIVCDGCPSDIFEKAIANIMPDSIDVYFYSYAENAGPGYARDYGIRRANTDLIAVMDSDDISLLERFFVQTSFFERNPNVSVCGGYIEEFDNVSGRCKLRRVPLRDIDIRQAVKIKSPVNNVTAMFRRKDYLISGGYPALRSSEDYSLWGRFLVSGFSIYNLDMVLVRVEFDHAALKRRNGIAHFKNDCATQLEMYKNGLISKYEFIRNSIKYCIFRFLPVGIKKILYQFVLRK